MWFLPVRRYPSAVFAVIASPSTICLKQLGVLLWWINVEFQKHRRKIVAETLVYDARDLYKIPMGSIPTGAPNAGRIGNIAFLTNWEVFSSDLLLKACLAYVHDGALTDEDDLSSTTLVIVALRWSQIRSSWYLQGWSYESLLITPMFTCVCDMLAVR